MFAQALRVLDAFSKREVCAMARQSHLEAYIIQKRLGVQAEHLSRPRRKVEMGKKVVKLGGVRLNGVGNYDVHYS